MEGGEEGEGEREGEGGGRVLPPVTAGGRQVGSRWEGGRRLGQVGGGRGRDRAGW